MNGDDVDEFMDEEIGYAENLEAPPDEPELIYTKLLEKIKEAGKILSEGSGEAQKYLFGEY